MAIRPTFVTIINDCRDDNARGRQLTRAAALLGAPVNFIGVTTDLAGHAADLEAAGMLIDALDAATGQPGVILVNVAPRNGEGKRWPNGTPFGYFRVGEVLVVASIAGFALTLIKKLGLAETVEVFDIPTVVETLVTNNLLDADTAQRITATQFRSFEFLPRAAAWLGQGYTLPTDSLPISEIAAAPQAVWWVDNFGNCKTTVLADELTEELKTRLRDTYNLAYYDRLKDVPNGECALVTGSSGLGNRRFIEIVMQGGSAAAKLGLKTGSEL